MRFLPSKFGHAVAAAALAVCALPARSQSDPQATVPDAPPPVTPSQPAPSSIPAKDSRITPRQAKELFQSLNQILDFASQDTDLPIRHKVKRRLISRSQVEKYILDKFHDDKDAKRMQREEIVLKKFGLLDADFKLQPFLVSLLTEQIAGFYDNKTKTVNLLDWVAPDEQKPVMAHELTHALQDQHTDLEKWEPDTPDTIAVNVTEDNDRLATDERDTARDAVLEGQAMAVYIDYTLQPEGRSLRTSPDLSGTLKDDLEASGGSPVMERAPLLLQESLLFPYRDGLGFEQTLLKDKGAEYAFAGVLDRPPSSSYEIMNPRAYERRKDVPLLRMPDVHALLNPGYAPYDIGVMGELDVRILTELFGGAKEAEALTPEWDGGLYYAVQSKQAATPAEKASTASLGLLYLSAWRSEGAAEEFAKLYGRELGKQYSGVARDPASESAPGERVYRTGEGPVLIVRQRQQVFVSESLDLALARKLQLLMFGAQGDGEQMQADRDDEPAPHSLTAPLIGFLAGSGMMKAGLR